MSSFAIAALAVVFVLACSAIGGFLRNRLPGHHLEDDTKDMVKVGIGLLSTLTALVLGLLLAAGKSSFENMSDQAQASAVKLVLLDQQLRQLGSAAEPARNLLRETVSARVAEIWGNDALPSPATRVPRAHAIEFQRTLAALAPSDEARHRAWSKAVEISDELAEVGFLSRIHARSQLTAPLLVVIFFWLGVISIGLNIYAPRNATVVTLNVVTAFSIAGAIFLFLEMDQPYGGILKISPAPLRAALVQLAQ